MDQKGPVMKNHHFKLFIGVATGALLVLGQAFAEAEPASDGFRDIRVAPGQAIADDFIEVILPFIRNHPETEEGDAGLSLDIQKDGSGYSVQIVMTGYLDDAVAGEHYRGHVIRTADGRWELLSMAVKPICARGTNVGGVCKSAPPAMFLAPGAPPASPKMCVNVAADDLLNVRSGPGTRFPVTGALSAGTCDVELTETCEGNWCQITADRVSGWVNTRYLISSN